MHSHGQTVRIRTFVVSDFVLVSSVSQKVESLSVSSGMGTRVAYLQLFMETFHKQFESDHAEYGF